MESILFSIISKETNYQNKKEGLIAKVIREEILTVNRTQCCRGWSCLLQTSRRQHVAQLAARQVMNSLDQG